VLSSRSFHTFHHLPEKKLKIAFNPDARCGYADKLVRNRAESPGRRRGLGFVNHKA
jgi:hypothetical protein